jgi:hypothetical protein
MLPETATMVAGGQPFPSSRPPLHPQADVPDRKMTSRVTNLMEVDFGEIKMGKKKHCPFLQARAGGIGDVFGQVSQVLAVVAPLLDNRNAIEGRRQRSR